VALDVGTVRTGVAVSDPTGSFAQGVTVLSASGDWMEELAPILAEYGADAILIGMPRRTDGLDGPEAVRMGRTAERLACRFPGVEIIRWDERFTTTIATRTLLEGDVSRSVRKRTVDKVAAVVLLQGYLDSLRGGAPASVSPDQPVCGGEPRHGGRRGGRRAYG
jgi:putative Holliday junction resolvase